MNSRLLIPVLCVGAVVYACGPRARNDRNDAAASNKSHKSTTKVASAAATSRLQGAPQSSRSMASRKTTKTAVAAQLSVDANDSTIRLALHIVNHGKKSVELRFPSGQTHDFVIVDSVGREVWRWASGRMFTQTLQNKLLSGGESLSLAETLVESLAPGTYTARATLTSQNYPLVEQSQFTITPRTVASR